MKEIGGYFELELNKGVEYHSKAIKLNTGRNCLEYILRARGYKKIYIPYFTCEVILEPIQKLCIEYEFYSIDDQLNPDFDKDLADNEVFLYTNYFGIKTLKIKELASKIKNLIIDNSQAFYVQPIDGVDTFYSARKFFGVPDGAYLYTNAILPDNLEQDISYKRFQHLLKRIDLGASAGYSDFKRNDTDLINQPIKQMSKLTSSILSYIDYDNVASVRKCNFEFLHSTFKEQNKLILDTSTDDVPLVYPLLLSKSGIKKTLIKNKIYVATYWPNVLEWVKRDYIEYELVKKIIPLPIDQRYGIEDIHRIINAISDAK